MPPKKDSKGQNDKPDNTGIPKNNVMFKFTFSVQTGEQLPQSVIMYQWLASSDKLERYDTGLVQNWTKKQKTLVFEKAFDAIKIDDQFCKKLSSHRFYIYFVNPQTFLVEDQLILDYSCLLFQKGQFISYQFHSSTIKVNNLDSFSLKIQADKELLTQMYREYLNPLQVEVIGALDPPNDSSSKYLPSYVKYKFFDETVVQTNTMFGQDKIIWQHKHVFLAGLVNPIQLQEKVRSNYLKFEFHDRDQIQNNQLKEDIQLFDIAKAIAEELEKDNPVEQDPKKKGVPPKKQPEKKQAKKETKKDTKKKDAKIADPILPQAPQISSSNYGVAVFSLVQFLKPAVKAAKYKSPVIPRTMFEDFESRNIDLNTTARNQMQKVLFSNNYFDHDTTIVVAFNLSYPIGSFIERYGKGQPQNPVSIDDNLKKSLNNFERLVVFLPYKDKQNVQKLENIFYEVNMKAFGLKNKREITTHLLKKEDKISTELDYLSGFEIIDPEGRVYIIEGLKGKSISKIYEALPKQVFNRDKQKILKNTKILFTSRTYADFNIQLKRIRLRPSLNHILLDPSIYIKSKVDEKICENLNKLSELRKICDDLQTVSSMDLWPDAETLVQIQRKYSQSLTYEDINGEKQDKKNKSTKLSTTKQPKSIEFIEKQGYKFKTADDFFNTKVTQPMEDTKNIQTNDLNTSLKKTVHTKTFIRDNPMKQTYNFHLTAIPSQNQPVYIYASQKLNWYQKQNQLLRQKIQNDKNKMYTLSKDYLSLSIDPHLVQIQTKKQLEMSKSKNYSPQKFSSLLIKTKEERMKIAKQPGPQDIADMIKYPYHEQKEREIQIKKSQRDKPSTNGKEDFKKYLKKLDLFSQPEVLQIQKMARVEQQRLLREQKLRRQEQEKKKLFGDPNIKTKKGYCSDKATNLDKFTNILEGSPNKKGIIDVHKKSKQKRPVQNYEVSLYLKQKINNPAWNPLIRVDEESKNIADYEFNNYQKPQFLTQTGIYKPLKEV